MEKLVIKYFFFVFVIITSCKQKSESSSENYLISNRSFNFQNETSNIYQQEVTVINKSDCKLFLYPNSEIGADDSLKMLSTNKIYYNGVQLKKIDSKFLKVNNSSFDLNKYYFEDKKNYQGDCYIFINSHDGIIFNESLNSGTMIEYNIRKFKGIHQKIALRQLGFKEGKFEIQLLRKIIKLWTINIYRTDGIDYRLLKMVSSMKYYTLWI